MFFIFITENFFENKNSTTKYFHDLKDAKLWCRMFFLFESFYKSFDMKPEITWMEGVKLQCKNIADEVIAVKTLVM